MRGSKLGETRYGSRWACWTKESGPRSECISEAATSSSTNAALRLKCRGEFSAANNVCTSGLTFTTPYSGNITLHCETALNALRSFAPEYRTFRLDSMKARLVLMTAEPDAFERIAAEPICHRHFEIVPFPRGGTDKSYKQADFYELSAETRLEDTQRFLAEADILANYVDATVVSANSNTGRLIFTRGGPTRAIDEYRIRSVDVPWHVSAFLRCRSSCQPRLTSFLPQPMQFAPFAGFCDGTAGHCFPE